MVAGDDRSVAAFVDASTKAQTRGAAADAGPPAREADRRKRVLAAVVAGAVIGTVEVVIATSFAVVVFAGDLDVHVPSAIGLALFGGGTVMALLALLGSVPGTVGSVQDVAAAILAGVAASVAARLPPEGMDAFLTVVLAIVLSSVFVGVSMLLLGTLRLGNLIRFVPYPVVGGFLGGTGVLLVEGAVGVMTGASFRVFAAFPLLREEAVLRWLPGFVIAAVLLFLLRRGGDFLLVPAAFLSVTALFYVAVLAAGRDAAWAEASGWLLGPFPEGALWRPWTLTALMEANWSVVVTQSLGIATIMVLSALGLLLNATGLELEAGHDVDLDRELRAAGLANLVAGLGGGLPGYHAVSLSALAHQMGAASRLVGLLAAGVCGFALAFGAATLSLIPRLAVGTLLLFIGLALVVEWTYDTWFRVARSEYAVMVLIVAVIAGWGFGPGVVAGLMAAVVLFLIDYSRIDVVKHALTGVTYQSNVDRSPEEQQHLRGQGLHVEILQLHGFLFFGTANSLFERIRTRVMADDLPPVHFLVLGFRRVYGLDSSAAVSFVKLCRLAAAQDIGLVLTGLRPHIRRTLDRAGIAEAGRTLWTFSDLDHGVEWCEDRLLERAAAALVPTQSGPTAASAQPIELGRLRPYLERIDLQGGEVVIRQGERTDDLFFLESGRLTVQLDETVRGAPVRLRSVAPGTVVGELTRYLGTPRSATVIADGRCTVYRLSGDSLQRLENGDPDLALELHRWLAALMARRIVDSDRTIAALLD